MKHRLMALQKGISLTPGGSVSFISETPQRVSEQSTDIVVYSRPETGVSPSARLENENRPDAVGFASVWSCSLTCA